LLYSFLTPALESVGVTNPVQILGINAGLAVWNLILAQTSALNIEKFGIRPLFFASTIGMIISYAFVMGFSAGFAETGKSALGIAAIPFLFFFYGSYDIAWTPLNYSYVSAIMPFNLRTKGLAIYIGFQNIGNAFNQFVNPIALSAIKWKYYAVYIAIDLGYLVFIYFCCPEIRGLTIEETSIVFDYPTKDGHRLAQEAFRTRLQADTMEDKLVEKPKVTQEQVEVEV
jgi:hypothetical protein